MAERLRVGILCDGPVFRHWQAECIRHVLAVEGVEPVVIIEHDRIPKGDRKPAFKYMLYRWFKKNRLRSKALGSEDLSTLLAGIPRLTCRPIGPSTDQRFEADDLAAIWAYRPDVLLRFGFDILHGDILTMPTHGVWSYHHGDEEVYRGRPEGFWEIVHGEDVTGATLQRLTDDLDAGLVLRKGWFRTVAHSLSDNLDKIMLGSTAWMAQTCLELLMGNADAAKGVPSNGDAHVRKVPDNLDMLSFLIRGYQHRNTRDRRHAAVQDEWNIGVLYQPIASLLEPKPSLNVRWLPSPSPGQQRRSPFGYLSEGQLNVLYGKYDALAGKGDISRLRPKRDNVLKRSRTMLSTGKILTYPYLIEHAGQLLVVPESGADTTDLYRMNQKNDSLELVGTILEEGLRAPTVFQHEGRWWLFGTKDPWAEEALYAYHASAPEGPWTPHALNPVKTDVRSARPAGTPFMHEGHLYRPANDNSLHEGCRVAFMRVLELSPTSFREELVRTIGPMKGSTWSHGTGTLSAVGDLTLVDGKRPMSARPPTRTKGSGRKGGSAKREMSERERDLEDDQDD